MHLIKSVHYLQQYAVVKTLTLTLQAMKTKYLNEKLEVLRQHRPPPNASIIELWQFFPDPDRDSERTPGSGSWCGYVISWSLGHTPALHKISSKSVGNFFDNPVNPDFGLRTPGSGRWSELSPKFNHLVPGPCPIPPRYFIKICSQLFKLSVGSNRVKIWVGGKLGKEWSDFDFQRSQSYFLGSRLWCKVSSK